MALLQAGVKVAGKVSLMIDRLSKNERHYPAVNRVGYVLDRAEQMHGIRLCHQ